MARTVVPVVDHWGYVAVAIATHAALGYALVRTLTACPPSVGAVAGVAPDVDLLFGPVLLGPSLSFPLVHRGVLHTPAFLALVVGGLLLAGRVRANASGRDPGAGGVGRSGRAPVAGSVSLGVGVAYFSHLAIDSLTRSGIMWLYPLSDHSFGLALGVHGVAGTTILWLGSIGLVRWGGRGGLRWIARG